MPVALQCVPMYVIGADWHPENRHAEFDIGAIDLHRHPLLRRRAAERETTVPCFP